MTEMIRVITGDGLLPSDHSFALSIQRGVVTHAIPIERLSRLLQCEEDGGGGGGDRTSIPLTCKEKGVLCVRSGHERQH